VAPAPPILTADVRSRLAELAAFAESNNVAWDDLGTRLRALAAYDGADEVAEIRRQIRPADSVRFRSQLATASILSSVFMKDAEGDVPSFAAEMSALGAGCLGAQRLIDDLCALAAAADRRSRPRWM
jgi:hypothetical protein